MTRILTLLFLLSFSICQGKDFWEAYEVPNGSPIMGFNKGPDGTLFATGFGFYKSNDEGKTWTSAGKFSYDNKDYTFEEIPSFLEEVIAVDDSTLLTGCYDGPVFISNDQGNNWTMIQDIQNIRSFAVDSDGVIYAGTGYSYAVSADKGKTWYQIELNMANIGEIRVADKKVYAGTNKGMYLIVKKGNDWVLDYEGMTDSIPIYTFDFKSNNVFAGNNNGVFKSTDLGKTWSSESIAAGLKYVRDVEVGGDGVIYAATYEMGLWYSADDGVTWQQSSISHASSTVFEVEARGNEIYVSSIGIYHSADNGKNWDYINKGLGPEIAFDLAFDKDNSAFALTYNGLMKKENAGADWLDINSAVPQSDDGFREIIAGKNNSLYIFDEDHLYKSSDKGISWTDLNVTIKDIRQVKANSKGELFVFNRSDSLFKLNNDEPEFVKQFLLASGFFIGGHDELVVPTYFDTLYISKDNGAFWETKFMPDSVIDGSYYSFCLTDSGVFAVAMIGYDVYRTTDWGANWTKVDKNIENLFEERELTNIGNDVYLTTFQGIYKFNYSTGAWDDFNYGLKKVRMSILTLDNDNRMYIVTKTGTYRSIDPVPVPTGVDETVILKDRDMVYPNPSNGFINVKISEVRPEAAYTIKVLNSTGGKVNLHDSSWPQAGQLTISMDTGLLAPGVYFIIFSQDGKTRSIPFAVVK